MKGVSLFKYDTKIIIIYKIDIIIITVPIKKRDLKGQTEYIVKFSKDSFNLSINNDCVLEFNLTNLS